MQSLAPSQYYYGIGLSCGTLIHLTHINEYYYTTQCHSVGGSSFRIQDSWPYWVLGRGLYKFVQPAPVASWSVGNFLQLCVDNRLPTLPQFTLSQPGIALCVPRMQPTTTRVLLQCGCHYNVYRDMHPWRVLRARTQDIMFIHSDVYCKVCITESLSQCHWLDKLTATISIISLVCIGAVTLAEQPIKIVLYTAGGITPHV